MTTIYHADAEKIADKMARDAISRAVTPGVMKACPRYNLNKGSVVVCEATYAEGRVTTRWIWQDAELGVKPAEFSWVVQIIALHLKRVCDAQAGGR